MVDVSLKIVNSMTTIDETFIVRGFANRPAFPKLVAQGAAVSFMPHVSWSLHKDCQ